MSNRWRPGWKSYTALWVAMMLIRQNGWWWSDRTLLLGVLPVGLAYQACYSLLAALVLYGLVTFAWPHELEAMEDGSVHPDEGRP